MRAVTRRTGLTPDVLRVWERRYAIVNPIRSSGGQRLYSASDLERLITLSRLVRAGHRIAMLARLDDAALAKLAEEGLAAPPASDRAADFVAQALDATADYDDVRLDHALRVAALSFPAMEWIERVVHPFLLEVGERWHRGEVSPAHEHLASASVRDTLGWVLGSLEPVGDAPIIVVATPAGELHEFGAMMAAVIAAGAGWRVRYLGPNLPAPVLAECASTLDARAVGLSIVHATGTPIAEIERLCGLLGDRSLIVGGRGAVARASTLTALGVTTVATAGELARHLAQLEG